MDETEKKPAADMEPQEAKPEQFDGRNPHENQMDDLFGDMRQEQLNDEKKEDMARVDNQRFAAKKSSSTEGALLAARLLASAVHLTNSTAFVLQISASERMMTMLPASTRRTRLTSVKAPLLRLV